MRYLYKFHLIAMAPLFIAAACTVPKNAAPVQQYNYVPDDQELHNTTVKLDSAFFEAYNTCNVNLATYSAFFADSIEFYHDQGGLMNSKADIVEATRRNVCGKVRRELVKGSIEVYPIKNYGAVEMGIHRFRNNTDPSSQHARDGKFIIIWQHKNNNWKITKVVSLH